MPRKQKPAFRAGCDDIHSVDRYPAGNIAAQIIERIGEWVMRIRIANCPIASKRVRNGARPLAHAKPMQARRRRA
ncbi:hypothetical protein [Burkholderia lata]|uniref:hypothetical protein n=1 Tax=Burkholderia lata (strain ATCC 17760 / DSM 23089 / LMG 22485 / NCIMB 9086 / R18194 / 383) TaxID=482957 RepID=UPI0015829957|nr:hypothetical protein [Burkholderia lata]